MREEFALRRFVMQRLNAIPNKAVLFPDGIHEDEVPRVPTNTAPETAVAYQVETSRVLHGMGGVIIWAEFFILIDVTVPGRSRLAGEAGANAVRDAFHGATGLITGGRITSCIYEGSVPLPPEHTEGISYEHLMQRFKAHAQAV